MPTDTSEAQLFDALRSPENAVALELTAAVRRLRPSSFVAYSEIYAFDPMEFAQLGQATLTARSDVPSLLHWGRTESGNDAWTTARSGWFDVSWKGTAVELVAVTFGVAGAAPETCWWIIGPDEAAVKAFFLAVCRYTEDVHGQVLVFNDGEFSKSTELHRAVKDARWDDLVLPGTLARDIRADARRFFDRKAFYESHRLPWKRGLLFIGPPGNGKTHSLRALLNELDRPVIFVRGFQGRNSTVAGGIAQIFERARRMAPAVVVLEDLDCLVDDASRSLLLNELDGVARNHGLFVVATTNHPEKLDRSLLDRPSRFDRKFHFPLPDADVRRAYLTKLTAREAEALQLSAEAIDGLVERTNGFTFAYLKELLLNASLTWADEDGARPFEVVARETVKLLRVDLKTADASLGSRQGVKSIGFAEA